MKHGKKTSFKISKIMQKLINGKNFTSRKKLKKSPKKVEIYRS